MPDRTSPHRPSARPPNDPNRGQNITQPIIARLYTPAEAAAMLAVKESWLRRKASRRTIPCTFVGKHLRFSTDDLHEIIQQSRSPVSRSRSPH